ncbi:MAG: hypothetical protein WD826_06635 [Actinomycetota bacterium]
MKRVAIAFLLLLGACGRGGESTSTPTTAPEASAPSSTAGPANTPRELAVTELPAEPSGAGTCGDYEVSWSSPEVGEGDRPAELSVERDGERVFALGGTNPTDQLIALWCGDITGDGKIELGVEEFTAGAHCCWGIRVITLDGRETLLNRDLGNAGGPEPEQLDATQPLEIVTDSDVLAYFGDLPYAASPFLPLVFAFEGGAYKVATTDFPEYIRSSLTEAEQLLNEAIREQTDFPEAIRGAAIGVYGHHVLLGDPDGALDDIATELSAADAQWLRDHAAEAVDLIRS